MSIEGEMIEPVATIELSGVYSEDEAIRILRIGKVSLWKLRKARQIDFRRVCGKILYTGRDLSDFLERSKQAAV